jgi:hypothetical protein
MINITKDTRIGELLAAGINVKLDIIAPPVNVIEQMQQNMPEEPKKEKLGRKPKAPEKAPEPVVEEVSTPEPTTAPEITDDMLRDALKRVAAEKGPASVIELTGPIKDLSELDDAKRKEIMEAVK